MILCAVENKKFTNTIYEAYNYYNNVSDNVKFKTHEEDLDSDKYDLIYNDFNFNKYFNKNKYTEMKNNENKNKLKRVFSIHHQFLYDLEFYQCESPINDFDNYSNYFTLSSKFLKDKEIFRNHCDNLTNFHFLNSPIQLKKDPKNKTNFIFNFPEWIQENNKNNQINENYPHDSDEIINNNNESNEFTLAQFILALIEQVLSIRYLLYKESRNLNEIISSIYLYELLDKKHLILTYINSIKIETNMYYKFFKIDDIMTNIFLSQEIEIFIKAKKSCIKISDDKSLDSNNNESDSIFMNSEKTFQDLDGKYKNNKSEFNKELINTCTFFSINKLFTIDDFFLRSIFENFYSEYINKIYNDLTNDKGEKPKKKKKKKKRNNTENSNNKKNNNISNNDESKSYKEEMFDFLKKLILDNFEEKINKINHNNNVNNNKKEKEKYKEFFLYEPVKKKEKKKINHSKNKKNNHNNTNNKEENDKNNVIEDNNIINGSTSTNDTNINNGNLSINKSDSIFHNKNIFINKMIIPYENLNKLNDDIDSFNKDMESILIIIREIKKEIKCHFELIIKNIFENDSKIEIYGSSYYQLDIESSDLDLSISTNTNFSLDALARYLTNNNSNNQYIDIKYIFTASIPIIKFISIPPFK